MYRWESQCVSICQNFVEIGQPLLRYDDFSTFSKWRQSAILDLLWACLDNPRKVFDDLYHCTKFPWNQFSTFRNMQVLIFNKFGLKMFIHAPKMKFWGIISCKWAAALSRSQKAPRCVETRHTMYRSLRSVQPSLRISPFYPIPKILRFAMGHALPKSVPSCGSICTPSNTWFPG